MCEQCFLCRSLVFCKNCTKCPTCCNKSDCRGQTVQILGNLGNHGGWTKGSTNVERKVHLTFPSQTKSDQVTHSCQLLSKSPQEQLPVRGIASADKQKCNRTCNQPRISGVLQPTLFGPKTKQQMETHIRFEQYQQISQGSKIQDGDPRNNPDLPPGRGVGYVHRFPGRLLPYTHTNSLKKIPEISCRGQDISIQSISIWPVHSTTRVYGSGQRGQIDGLTAGYKNPPVPRRLVGLGHIPPNLSPTYQGASIPMSGPRLGSEFRKVRTGTQAGVRLCGLSVRPSGRQGQTHIRPVDVSQKQNNRLAGQKYLSSPAVDVPYRSVNSYRKTGPSRQTSYEAHTMAPQKQLEGPRITRKGDTSPHGTSPTLKMVDGGEQCAPRSTITPFKTCSADIYRRIKRRVGRSLRRAYCKRNLVTSRNQTTHKLSGVKGSLPGLKKLPSNLLRQNSTGSNRQHNSGGLHKQGRGHEVGPTLCPTMENLDLVYQKSSNAQSPTHSRSAECGSGQALQTRPDHPNIVVSPARGLPNNLQQVAPPPDRPFCDKIQSQVTSFCVSSTRPPGNGSGCTQPNMGGSGCIRLSTSSHLGQSGGEASGLSIQKVHSDRSGVAQDALVLGSSGDVDSNSLEPTPPTKSVDSALQSDP